MSLKRPLPVIDNSNGSEFVKLARNVNMRVGEKDENPLLQDKDKRCMNVNY
jgi:hypothetical protein